MKAVSILFLLFLILTAAGWIWWQRGEPPLMPFNHEWTDTQGRTVRAAAIGRTGPTLHLTRLADEARFELPIDRLSWKDRLLALRLPEQAPPAPVVVPVEDAYVTFRRHRIHDLSGKVEDYRSELLAGSKNTILMRKRASDLEATQREILELEEEIRIHKNRGARP